MFLHINSVIAFLTLAEFSKNNNRHYNQVYFFKNQPSKTQTLNHSST